MNKPSRELCSAVIVAGGMGQRLRTDVPKAFVLLGDRPLFTYALTVFDKHESVSDIVVVVPENWLKKGQTLCAEFHSARQVRVVSGGKERWQSVKNGVASTDPQTQWVLVHDAARPFTTSGMIDNLLGTRGKFSCAITATPVVDTIRSFEDDRCLGTIDRSRLLAVQTPQLFRKELLAEGFTHAQSLHPPPTDEAMLMEKMGYPVGFVWGDPMNFKITTSQDLEIAEAILQYKNRAG